MFIHMSIHYPHKSAKTKLRESMHRFKAAVADCDGFIEGLVLEDENSNKMMELIKWKSKTHMMEHAHLATEAVKHDDFNTWEKFPPEVYYLNDV